MMSHARRWVRMLAVGGVLGAVLAGGLAVDAIAAPPVPYSVGPFSAQGCSNNTCVLLSGNAGGTALVQGWAYHNTFTGYFHLSGPGVSGNSANQTWYGGKGNYAQWTIGSAPAGQYCVSGYSNSGGYQGTACETLS